jgi:hypothetical protein
MAIDKNWTLNCLRHNRNSGLLSLASLALLNSPAVELLRGNIVVLRGDEVIFGSRPDDRVGVRFEVPLEQVAHELATHPDRFRHSLGEYMRWARRNLLKESFEIAKAYANTYREYPAFKTIPCFTFARIIRNSVSHDLHFRFRSEVLRVLPVSYAGVTLDASLKDQPMQENHLSPWLAWTIHEELVAFVTAH